MQRRLKLVSGQADNSLIDTPPHPPGLLRTLLREPLFHEHRKLTHARGKKSDILLHVLYVV